MKENENLKTYSLKDMTNYKLTGRTDTSTYPLPLFWNNSGIELNCTGSELWVDVTVDCDFFEPWVATELNGAFMSRQMLLPGEYSVCLYRSTSFGTVKNVRFFREIQALGDGNLCYLLIRGFKTDGEFLPVEDKKYKLEFVGDSITSGEGTYGAGQDVEWISMYMSASRNFTTEIAHRLDADVSLISQGGWGVYTGWDNDRRHNIPAIYTKICGTAEDEANISFGAHKDYDFTKWVPDAIIVNLGTNDATSFNQPPMDVPGFGKCEMRLNPDGTYVREDELKIVSAVIDFLRMLRRNNPTSKIVWAYGMLGYNLTLTLTEGISRYKDETGDSDVFFINLPNTLPDQFGSHGHPGFESHAAAAKVLADFLKSIL